MGIRAQWDALAARLATAVGPFQELELVDLWALACEEGPRRLAKFRRAGRALGIAPGTASAVDCWRVRAEMFLDTFERHF